MKRLYNLLLIFSLFVAISLYNTMIANAADYVSVGTVNNQSQFTIDTPYEYPVHPGMEEWEALDDHAKKIELCQIPEEILEKMTTEALAESVLNYPLLIDMYVWESNSKGYEFVSETFNGMYELRQRSDGLLVLQRLALNGYQESDDSSVSLKNMYLRTLVEKMSEENANLIVPYSSIEQKGDIKTPKGSYVYYYKGLTWTDHNTTFSEVKLIQNQLLEAYPSTVIYQNVNPAYNCHSFAWYSQSASNNYWINDPSVYWNDGSYRKISSWKSSAKVYYGYSGYEHSAIALSTEGIVKSKWGNNACFQHKMTDCPYYVSSAYIKYYY